MNKMNKQLLAINKITNEIEFFSSYDTLFAEKSKSGLIISKAEKGKVTLIGKEEGKDSKTIELILAEIEVKEDPATTNNLIKEVTKRRDKLREAISLLQSQGVPVDPKLTDTLSLEFKFLNN